MLKEFQNVKVNFEADALVEIKDKIYKIHDCIEGEDILVETEGKYPTLSKILKPSVHRQAPRWKCRAPDRRSSG